MRTATRLLSLCAAFALVACASRPLERYSETTPATVLATIGDAGVVDLRASYRDAVCARLPLEAGPCDDVLLRLPGEAPIAASAVEPAAAADLPQRYRIAFVPGFLAECFGRFGEPFADVRTPLEAEGFVVDYLRVSGRGSVAANARHLAGLLEAGTVDSRPYIVFAHSKGMTDMLELMARYPQAAERIAALVGVAGAVNGSPLADRLDSLYRLWAAAFPLPECDAGDGAEIRDLRRDVRLEWWRRHGVDVKGPVFTLVAAPRPDRISPASRAGYDWLAAVDPRNDGRLLWSDQIAPRSYLLGYANADHYAVAIPVSRTMPALSFAFRDDVPRAALVRAAIDIVAANLRDGQAAATGGPRAPGQ